MTGVGWGWGDRLRPEIKDQIKQPQSFLHSAHLTLAFPLRRLKEDREPPGIVTQKFRAYSVAEVCMGDSSHSKSSSTNRLRRFLQPHSWIKSAQLRTQQSCLFFFFAHSQRPTSNWFSLSL